MARTSSSSAPWRQVRPQSAAGRARSAGGRYSYALHAAHRLHRDLKPANALVTRAGRVVVLDFSLVHEVDPLIPHSSRTQVAGTPAYMAPEQVLDGHVSEAADWHAVGVMLFSGADWRIASCRIAAATVDS